MSLDCGRKPEYPVKNHTCTGRTCKLHAERPQLGIKPTTFLLQHNSATNCATVQPVSSGVLPNPIAVNNHQDDQVPDSACTSGSIRWKEHRSGLIGTPLPSDCVSTPRDQERRTWFSGDSIQADSPPLA
ncbi:hypothetical protein ATANTOWER_031055 [Ataeniobius toweri]|uniref:Uncharacterized protein n=1 Tax=Ataeniobius toweri TaxID=208326 RepID=A0ABU7ASP2_9TELE|nr:hypothetical protein [Ataeniobius toweri]